MTIVITIDGKPVAKGRGKIGRMSDGRPVIFTPAKTRANENLIKMASMQAMEGRDPLACPVRVTVFILLPIPTMSVKRTAMAERGEIHPVTKPDIDNYVKSALDGMNSIVFKDDNQVVALVAQKKYSTKPSMTIFVDAMEELNL